MSKINGGGLYLPALDGIRFVAFLLVFVHHLPAFHASSVLGGLHSYGWVGVELFFVISSYLFFHLLSAEQDKKGRISVPRFYVRRLLRIYPLMIAFPVLMLLLYGPQNDLAAWRLAGIALFSDNIVAWINGYNGSIPFSAHLWTLSFEFQIYLVIPVAFIGMLAVGKRRFALILLGVFVFCLALRILFFGVGASHPLIWVTPILRPESILAGLALALYRPQWNAWLSGTAAAIFAMLFFSQQLPWASSWSNIIQYPLAALMCASLVDFTLRAPRVSAILSHPFLRRLGTISFGLYVFHFVAIQLAVDALTWIDGGEAPDYAAWQGYGSLFVTALIFTVILANLSYEIVERPFLKIKTAFSVVDGRSVREAAVSAESA